MIDHVKSIQTLGCAYWKKARNKNLQVGDIIRLDSSVNQDLNIFVGNIKKFTAVPGSSKDKYAIQITSVLREEE